MVQQEELGIPTSATTTTASDTSRDSPTTMFSDDIDNDSTCSTPYVSAPSSPGRGTPISGFYYSAPASPMHFILSTSAAMSMNSSIPTHAEVSPASSTCSFEFDFSARLATNGTASAGSMSSADELFLNGQIRPMKLSTHLQRPQMLAPLLDLEDPDDAFGDEVSVISERGRDSKLRDRSLRRRTRSMSPLRSMSFEWHEDFDAKTTSKNEEKKKHSTAKDKQLCNDVDDDDDDNGNNNGNEEEEEVVSSETTPCESGASSRSSSVGRSSRRWVFLKEFLYRSKSEGRNNGHKFWGSLSFSPVKDKIKMEKFTNPKISSNTSTLSSKEKSTPASDETPTSESTSSSASDGKKPKQSCAGAGAGAKDVKKKSNGKAVNGVGKRRVPPSPHELHYTANRAQAEEMRKKTFLPYKQGLLGCLGFSSKSYGAMNGFARALNPVSSR